MDYKIVADSSADILSLDGAVFESVPLKIITDEREFTDDADLDVYGMVEYLKRYRGRSSTSCPNADDWLKAFGNAKHVFCVTITGTLSGSYNAAKIAKDIYEKEHPGRRVFVLNSLTAGPEIALMAEKLRELTAEGLDFDEICRRVEEYTKNTGLLFMLESMKNLANNGRVSPLVARMAGLLGIRVVGKASDKGDLQPLDKCRGEAKALDTIVAHLGELGLKEGKVRICHCFNEKTANMLAMRIRERFGRISVVISRCRGLCSFYAEKGGLLVGFEKM